MRENYGVPEGDELLCSKHELPRLIAEAEEKKRSVLKDFFCFFNGDIDVKISTVEYPMGWGLKADLTVNGEVVRHYTIPSECFAELNNLVLNKMIEAGFARFPKRKEQI